MKYIINPCGCSLEPETDFEKSALKYFVANFCEAKNFGVPNVQASSDPNKCPDCGSMDVELENGAFKCQICQRKIKP